MSTKSVRRHRRYTGIVHYGKTDTVKRTQKNDMIADIDQHHLLPFKGQLDYKWSGSDENKKQILDRYLQLVASITRNKKSSDAEAKKYFKNGKFDPRLAEKFYSDHLERVPVKGKKSGDFTISQKAVRGILFEESGLDYDELVAGYSKAQKKQYQQTLGFSPKEKWSIDKVVRSGSVASFKGSIGQERFNKLKAIAKKLKKDFSSDEDFVDDIHKDPEFYEQALLTEGGVHARDRGTYRRIIQAVSGRDVSNRDFDEQSGKLMESYRTRGEKLDEEIGKQVATDMELGTPANWKENYTARAIVAKVQNQIRDHGYRPADWKKALADVSGGSPVLKYDDVHREAQGRPITYNKVNRWAEKLGITLEGFAVIDQKKKKKDSWFSGKKTKSSKGSGGGSYSGGGGGGYSSGGKSTDRPFFGGRTSVKIVGGEPRFTKEKSGARQWFEKRSKGLRGPTPEQRAKQFKLKYGGMIPEEQYRGVMERGNFFDRLRLKRMARKMAVDPTYMKNQHSKWMLEKGIAEAKLIRAQKESQRQIRAASSTWYSGWYRFSKYTKWIAAAALLVAILFLPMGLFYVLGWALAVGVIALFQFIIWVFMEFWFLVAQVLVSIVGLVGQAFVMMINWVGQTLGGALGQTYKPFDFQLVQNMLMFSQDSAGVYHVFQYTDTGGQKEILTWGALNLTPPAFLKLESFRPPWFDPSTIFGHIVPPVQAFFNWLYSPIAVRYSAWIADPATPWYWPGVLIGVPVIIAIIVIFLIYRFMKRRVYA